MNAAAALPYPRVNPHAIRVMALQLRRLAERADDATRSLKQEEAVLAAAWEGPASTVCRAELAAARALTRSVAQPLGAAPRVLLRFVESVLDTRQRIDRLRTAYDDDVIRHRRELERMSTQPDLPPSQRQLVVEVLQREQQHELQAHRRRHAQAVDELRVLARVAARRLQDLAAAAVPAGPGAQRSAATSEHLLAGALPMLFAQRSLLAPSAGSPPPHPLPPQLARTWWSGLTTDERNRLVTSHPRALGKLDGLPAATRSAANERHLNELVAALQSKPILGARQERSLENCLLVRSQLGLLRAKPDPVTGRALTAHLIVFDPNAFAGDGRVAVAVGDLDTADNVAYLVPGLGSTVSATLRGLTNNAHLVVEASARLDPGQTTAAVGWMGYDAPDLGNVASDTAARRGATLLIRDVAAMQAVRELRPHVAVIGHSYGSVTVGEAARRGIPGLDAAVLIGSPGPGVNSAAELDVPKGQVFTGANSRDLVTYLDWFGKDPTHESFGGVRFDAEDPTRHSYRMTFADHSKYYQPWSESLENITRVVGEDYDAVRQAPYRAEHWMFPDGINSDPETRRELVPRQR